MTLRGVLPLLAIVTSVCAGWPVLSQTAADSAAPATRRSSLDQQSALALVQGTRAGGGRDTPPARRRRHVTILDVYQGAASAKIVASDWVDCVHLARWNGRWVIVNVLWEVSAGAQE